MEFISKRKARIILYVIYDKSIYVTIYELKEKVRANMLKNIIIGLFSLEE